jgi:hypothetical protein
MKWEVNCRVRVQSHNLWSDIKLNHQLIQKLKLIENYELNHSINILTQYIKQSYQKTSLVRVQTNIE